MIILKALCIIMITKGGKRRQCVNGNKLQKKLIDTKVKLAK